MLSTGPSSSVSTSTGLPNPQWEGGLSRRRTCWARRLKRQKYVRRDNNTKTKNTKRQHTKILKRQQTKRQKRRASQTVSERAVSVGALRAMWNLEFLMWVTVSPLIRFKGHTNPSFKVAKYQIWRCFWRKKHSVIIVQNKKDGFFFLNFEDKIDERNCDTHQIVTEIVTKLWQPISDKILREKKF